MQSDVRCQQLLLKAVDLLAEPIGIPSISLKNCRKISATANQIGRSFRHLLASWRKPRRGREIFT
jgi:hypothetical protein